MALKFKYNAPFSLSFALFCAGILVLNYAISNLIGLFFTLPSAAAMNWGDPLTYLRLFSHAAGHQDWNHYLGNFSFILILGPILEEKYSPQFLGLMCFITALVTGILHSILPFSTGLLGASGIVFMMIVLVSFTNIKSGEIPLTFIAVVVVYLGKEIIGSFGKDNISQYAHLMGGISGALFGFFANRFTENRSSST